jgi:peptidoglycan/LPS O-acetylase OafA/YrhL
MRAIRIDVAPRFAGAGRIAAIDELKGVAIALVLAYHCLGALGFPNYIHGEIGVDIFLIVSGLALAAFSSATPLPQFLLRRFLRIYPSYWLALGLFAWLDQRYLGPRPWESLWQHAVGVHAFSRLDYFSDYSQSFWFVSLILAAYVVFACIRGRLDDLSLVFGVCGLLTAVAVVLYQINGHQGGVISLAVRIPSFFAGLVAGRLLGAGTAEIRLNLSLGLGILCFYYLTFFRGVTCAYTIPAMGIVLTWIALRPLLARSVEGRVLAWVLSAMGILSYEIYLFHQVIVTDLAALAYRKLLDVASPSQSQILVGVIAGLGVTLVISIAVHMATGWVFSLLPRAPSPRPRGASA